MYTLEGYQPIRTTPDREHQGIIPVWPTIRGLSGKGSRTRIWSSRRLKL